MKIHNRYDVLRDNAEIAGAAVDEDAAVAKASFGKSRTVFSELLLNPLSSNSSARARKVSNSSWRTFASPSYKKFIIASKSTDFILLMYICAEPHPAGAGRQKSSGGSYLDPSHRVNTNKTTSYCIDIQPTYIRINIIG